MVGIGTIHGYTTNYRFRLIRFDSTSWQDDEYANWRILDALLGTIVAVPNFRGVWTHSTVYTANDQVVDSESGSIYKCLIEHTSASSGLFGAERAANPTYWEANDSILAAVGAVNAQGYAQEWANKAEDSLVSSAAGGDQFNDYSAMHHALKAGNSVTQASVFTNAARAAQTAAETAQTAAEAAQVAVEALEIGLYYKEPVVVATTTNDSLTRSGEQTINGVTTNRSRILLKDQNNASRNGVYITAAGAWSRADDMDTWDKHVGAAIPIAGGTTHDNTIWFCTVNAGGILGSTDINFAQLGGSGLSGANNLSDLPSATAARRNLGLEIGVDVEGFDNAIMRTDTAARLTVGMHHTPNDAGTFMAGTYTPVIQSGVLPYIINNGNFSLGVPTARGQIAVQVTNGVTAGAINTNAYTRVDGDELTTTTGDRFILFITTHQNVSLLTITAMQ